MHAAKQLWRVGAWESEHHAAQGERGHEAVHGTVAEAHVPAIAQPLEVINDLTERDFVIALLWSEVIVGTRQAE